MGAGGAPFSPTIQAEATVGLSCITGLAARELGWSAQDADRHWPVEFTIRRTLTTSSAGTGSEGFSRGFPNLCGCPRDPHPGPLSCVLQPHGPSLLQPNPLLLRVFAHCSFLPLPSRLTPAYILRAPSDATSSERPSLTLCGQVPTPHSCLFQVVASAPPTPASC